MIRPIGIAAAILAVAAIPVFAQGSSQSSGPGGGQPPAVIGPTGTMYNGNNADLRLAPEQNPYWARLWAEPGLTGKAAPAAAVDAGAAGTSPATVQSGAKH